MGETAPFELVLLNKLLSLQSSNLFSSDTVWTLPKNTVTPQISLPKTAQPKSAQKDMVCAKVKNLAVVNTQKGEFSRLMEVPELVAEVKPTIKMSCNVASQT